MLLSVQTGVYTGFRFRGCWMKPGRLGAAEAYLNFEVLEEQN